MSYVNEMTSGKHLRLGGTFQENQPYDQVGTPSSTPQPLGRGEPLKVELSKANDLIYHAYGMSPS